MAKEQYIKRRDRVCARLHLNICKELWAKLYSGHWHEHLPKSVDKNHEGMVTILQN